MSCELCGSSGQLKRAIIESVDMTVCSNCASYGKELKAPPSARIPVRTPVQRVKPELAIVENYAQLIRKGREAMGLTQKEFASQLAEKESMLQYVESGHQEPDLKLARKLEHKLNIMLIEEVEAGTVPGTTKTEALTFGDLIKVRKR